MNSEPVVIEDDDDVDNGDIITTIIDDDVKIIEQKPNSPIVIDDEPAELNEACNNNTGTKTKILSKKKSKAEKDFRANLRNNNLMDKIIHTCMNMPNGMGMERVIQKTLVPLYRDSNPKLKKSKSLSKLLKNTCKKLLRDPDHKFLHIKTLCEELKSGRLRKKVPIVTLATNLRDSNKFTDTQTDLWHSGPSIEPNRDTVIEVESLDEIEENLKPKKRKQKDTISIKRKPKRQKTVKQSKKICNTENTKTDVIELDNSDNESGNLVSCLETTVSTTGGSSVIVSPNSSIGGDSNKDNNERNEIKEKNGSNPDNEHNGSKLEQENNKFLQHKINAIVFVPFYNTPIIQDSLLPMTSIPMPNPLLTLNGLPNPAHQNNKISKTVAVIEYNAPQNQNNLCSEDGVDIEVFIPQTYIENRCKETDVNTNSISNKQTCSNNETITNTCNGSRENGIIQDHLVAKHITNNSYQTSNETIINTCNDSKEKEIIQDHLVPKNSGGNGIVEDLLIPKNHIEIVSDDEPCDLRKSRTIAYHERCIALYKKELVKLEEQEVTTDDPKFSPYVLCATLKKNIVEAYKEICVIKGSSAKIVKRCKIRLKVAQGHHPGPAKQLQKFLNSNFSEDGLIAFPDYEDVLQCVFTSNREDNLGWTNNQVYKEAKALFIQCGKALSKRRQKREYQDLMSLVREKNLEDEDPAEKDPLLLAKLEKNKQIAKYNEFEILNRYAAMENLRYPDPGETGTVVFESDGDSGTDSESEDSEDNGDIRPSNQIERIQNTPDTSSTSISHSKDITVDINYDCQTPSLLKIIFPEKTVEQNYTNNNKSIMNVSSFENSALLNTLQKSSFENSNITQGVIREGNIESSSPTDVGNSSFNTDGSLAINVTDNKIVGICETDNISQEKNCGDNIKEERETIKINFSEPVNSISFIPNCNNSGTNIDSIESNVKIETTIIPERLDLQAMLNARGDNFECTVFDIEDPFLVIEISSDDYSDDDL